jgi:hypothetical protein
MVEPSMELRIQLGRPPLAHATVITASSGERKWRVLADCGLLAGEVASTEKVAQSLRALLGDREPAVDVVLATSHTRSRVAAFAHPFFADLRAREVWLSWVEDPADPDAISIRQEIAAGLARVPVGDGSVFDSAAAVAADGRRDAAAAEALLRRLAPSARRWLLATDGARSLDPARLSRPASFATPALPDTTVVVLSPSRPGAPGGLHAASAIRPAGVTDDASPFPAHYDVSQQDVHRQLGQVPPLLQMDLSNLGTVVAAARKYHALPTLALAPRLAATGVVVALDTPGLVLLLGGQPRPGWWEHLARAPATAHLLERADCFVGARGPGPWPPAGLARTAGDLAAVIDTGNIDAPLASSGARSKRFETSVHETPAFTEVLLKPVRT